MRAPPHRARPPGELALAVLLLLAAAAVLGLAAGIDRLSAPSAPGVFPMLAGAAMLGSASMILLGAARRPRPAPIAARAAVRSLLPARVLLIVALIVAFMLTLERAGFVLAATGFLVLAFLVLEPRRPLRAILVAAAAVAVVVLLFRHVFQVILPEGPWP